MRQRNMTRCLTFGLSLVLCHAGLAVDWNTYRGDISRSGATLDTVAPDPILQWSYVPTHAPKPAWPMPGEEMPRMHVDNAYQTAIVDGCVYFGSSVTNQVISVDAKTGGVRWSFSAQGPVRFAPTVSDGRVYFGSDDGNVYCLDAKDGSMLWNYRAGLSDEKVIGNERMISLWPVRTGVLVDAGVVYFAAGVFPYEGLYVCAVRAKDGSEVWKNDTIGDRAHELAYGGISPHGYPLASEEVLYVPSGRSMPVAFDRKTGKFLFSTSPGGKRGGTWALLDRDRLIAGVDYSGTPHKVAYDAKTGARQDDVFAWFPGIDMVVTSDTSYILTLEGVYAIDREDYTKALKEIDRLSTTRQKLADELNGLKNARGTGDAAAETRIDAITGEIETIDGQINERKESTCRWRYTAKELHSLILAGDTVFVGGQGSVAGLRAKDGETVWTHRVEGAVVSLAASEGRLVASSDTGPVYCFGSKQATAGAVLRPVRNANPYPDDALSATYEDAVKRILDACDARRGYCLVLDCGEGRLAYELAQKTEMKIVGLERDPKKLAAARRNLEAVGLLGARVVVEPWPVEVLPDYFANLIVSDGMLTTGRTASSEAECQRVLRPWGGVMSLGSGDGWRTVVREALEGAGDWTQQYGNPENTACSDDELVNGPLGILWFGEPGPRGMVERHGRAQSPVSMDGRMFVEGEELVMAVDAFNGTLLWKREIPGAVRVKIKADSGNLAVTHDGFYVAAHDKCYRLDPATGETMRVYDLPPSAGGKAARWGYVSVVDGVLYGTSAEPMDQDYGAILKAFVENGSWKTLEEVPEDRRGQYAFYRNEYPDPEDFKKSAQRSGILYRQMTSFGPGGEFTQKNAVTDGLMSGDNVFAIDTNTGGLLWSNPGERVANISVTFGDGKVFYADSGVTKEQRTRALKARRNWIESGLYEVREGILEELQARRKELELGPKEGRERDKRKYFVESLEAELFASESPEGSLTDEDADVRLVSAVDAKTGAVLWQDVLDLTGCGGDRLGAAYSDGLLLFFGNHGNHDAWRFREGGMKWRRITVVSADRGKLRWSRPLNYRTRPVIVGEQIILEPRACELQTGKTVMRTHPVTGEEVPWEFLRPGHTCGITAASTDGLFYRSACTAFYDLEKDRGITIFGGYRPGCAISLIPAGGLLLSPEAAAGCTCSYPIRCSMALKRKPNRAQPWTVYVTPGAMLPAKHLAVNLGASADMKDEEGTVWFGYPNPKTNAHTHFPNYGVKFDLAETILPEMGYFARDYKDATIAGTDRPWLFTSGCVGLLRCTLTLVDAKAEQDAAAYTVRLGFKAPAGDRSGQRVFDIKLQDKVVLKDCDVIAAAGSVDKVVVKSFENVRVKGDLVLELVPKTATPGAGEAPVVNFIEVIREGGRKVSVGPSEIR